MVQYIKNLTKMECYNLGHAFKFFVFLVFVKTSLKQSGESSDVKNESNINIHGSLLKIQNVQNSNERVYTCIAVDEAGNTKTQNISLKIIDNDDDDDDDDKNKGTGNKTTSLLVIPVFLIVVNFAWLFLDE